MKKMIFVMMLVLMFSGLGVVSAGLVGYWPLDGNAIDLSGNGNDGTISGNVAPTADRFGNPTGAMSFAGGGGDYIDVGNAPAFNLTGAMTITAWVYLDSTSNMHGRRNGRILAKMDGGGHRSWSSGIEKNANGVVYPPTIQIASDGNTVISFSDDSSMPLDQWVHFAGVYTPGESLAVYINGELAGVMTSGIPASQFSDNGVSVRIGNRPACGDCGWYGALDDVRIYDEALTGDQIKAIANNIQAANPDPEDGADRVALDATFSWNPPDADLLADPPAKYIVYFDPNESLVASGDPSVRFDQQSQTEFDPGNLELMSTYYWRVDVVDPNFGTPITYPGVVWKFTTVAPKAGLIFPADGATDTARNAVLQWDPGFGAISHKVYFGTDETMVANGDDSVLVGEMEDATFDPDLQWQTQYFWRVDEVFATGSPEPGDVWSFTTGIPVCEYDMAGDIDKNCVVDLADFALMASNWLNCNITNDDCP